MTPEVQGYRIQREIGKGGMGMVYLAERLVDGREVALKILPPNLLTPVSARRFQREGKALQALDHPNVVEVFEVGARDGQHFIAMEHLQGKTLSRLVEDSPGGLPIDLAVRCARGIAAALGAIHERSMTHRDIKPGNVMITVDGRLKLLDFGLVQIDDLTMLTATGNIVGTPTYMSPEQCSGQAIDHRSDIYSFGVLCYELFVGAPPFVSDSVYEVLENQRSAIPEAPRKKRRKIPADIEQIILQCLEKNPEERPPSIADLVSRLSAFGDDEELSLAATIQTLPQRRLRKKIPLVTALALSGATAFVTLSDLPPAEAIRGGVRSLLASLSSKQPDLRKQVSDEFEELRRAEAKFNGAEALVKRGDRAQAFELYLEAARTPTPRVKYILALVQIADALGRRSDVVPIVQSFVTKSGEDPGGKLLNWLERGS